LGGGTGAEGVEDDVCDALGCEDVSADYSGVVGWGEEGFLGDLDVDWFKATLIQRDILRD
jgi:hypothetical protein